MPSVVDMARYKCCKCGRVSHNPMDAVEGYCGACHEFTREYAAGPLTPPEGVRGPRLLDDVAQEA